ncbi:ABC transporter ATP-binding protein [Sedimentitalea sp.]|uniref:ABC transporter ATP-binding protein n=1 Tax=Sedimentitalea sp. TaxID=2048915 RepID=UPI003265F854
MIEIRNLTKVFTTSGRRHVVFENLNLTVPANTSVALLGRNGAGKSTLLQILAGTMDATSGEIITDSTISWPVGFAGSFHPELTGAQNTKFVARTYGIDTDEMRKFVEDFADLGQHFYLPLRTYSSGMKGRLAFGTSMAVKFDYYLVDESTAAGDKSFRDKAEAVFLDRMSTSGSFVVSHSMRQIKALCNVALVLEDGEITVFDDVEEAIATHEANMERAGEERRKKVLPGTGN